MPNGPEPPKVVLARQAEIPRLALAGSPVAALGEGLSGILTSIAAQVPEGLPGLPAGGAGGGLPPLPGVFKGIETALPTGFPKLLAGQGGAGEKTVIGPKTETPKVPARAFKIGV